VKPPCSVEIPNIITPNGDNVNDFFKIKNIEYHPNTSVTIYDRWGKKVYENPNYNNEWKGEGVSDGTFFYIIDVPDDKKYTNFITVFRD
jgi:gliding motility-associated-like protein